MFLLICAYFYETIFFCQISIWPGPPAHILVLKYPRVNLTSIYIYFACLIKLTTPLCSIHSVQYEFFLRIYGNKNVGKKVPIFWSPLAKCRWNPILEFLIPGTFFPKIHTGTKKKVFYRTFLLPKFRTLLPKPFFLQRTFLAATFLYNL